MQTEATLTYTDGNTMVMIRPPVTNCMQDFGKHFADETGYCSVCGRKESK